MQPNKTSQSLALPIAIVAGFSIIATAIFFSGSGTMRAEPTHQAATNTLPDFEELATRLHEPIAIISSADNIRGNPNAPVMFVTYTNYECPSCRNFHLSMNRILQEYGQQGDIAWTFRHLPLERDYPNANRVANAAECVAELGGNQAFWIFSDELFRDRSSLGPTRLSQLPQYATTAGVLETDFNRCMNEERHLEEINSQADDATASGAFSIPYTVVMAGEEIGVINGSVPHADLRQIVESAIAETRTTQ